MRIAAALATSLVVGLLAPLTACSSQTESRTISASEAKPLLIDRNWMDTYPKSDRDHLFVYRFVPNMGGGVFQDRTLFKGTFELFSFSATGETIDFVLHETKTKVSSKYTIERVDGPEPFDLKLTIQDDPRGPKVYFGMSAETDRDGMKLEQRLQTLKNQ